MLIFDKKTVLTCTAECETYSAVRGDITEIGAFSSDDTLTFTVRVPRMLCAFSAALELYRDDDMSTRRLPTEKGISTAVYDSFSVTLRLSEYCLDGGGLFYRCFAFDTPYGEIFASRDGSLTDDRGAVSSAQLTVFDTGFTVPQKFRGSVMYQIFVDRFFDGGRPVPPSDGKVRNPDWENGVPMYAEKPGDPLANNEFYGGNLWGVAKKLDYIASLGADTVYLCPVFEAASNHKYDAGDYERIDEMFGGEEAFDHLIAECKKRGMKLILDGVFNHTGADSKYFNKFGNYSGIGAYQSESSIYSDWYSFRHFPDEYRCWWGVDVLPAVNSENESYRRYICGENGIIRRYLRRGIDGWRLDVADELSDVFLYELRAAARAEKSDALIIGEVWEDASNKVAYDRRRKYFRGHQLDSVMNYPLKEAVIDYILTRDSARLYGVAKELWAHYPEDVSHALMNFLGTHDTERILTVLADAGTKDMTNAALADFKLSEEQRAAAKKRLKLAFALLCAFPGIPCIYYGDEAGMEGGRDPFNRRPFIWGREDGELTEFYRLVGNIRRNSPELANGSLELAETDDRARFMLIRSYEGRRLIAAVNLSKAPWKIGFKTEPKCLLSKADGSKTEILEPDAVEYFLL